MARIPNYKIDDKLKNFDSFENYNATIVGERIGSTYKVTHWRTTILEYDLDTKKVHTIALGYISQTTSTLLGRIIRALPIEVVEDLVRAMPYPAGKRRILSMARMLRR